MASALHGPDEHLSDDNPNLDDLVHYHLSNHEPLDYDDHIHLASLAEKKRLWWRNAFINTLFISSWYVFYCTTDCSLLPSALPFLSAPHVSHCRFVFATILSVYNKWMFSPKYFGFPYPLFVTTLHMFVQFILAAAIRILWPARFRPKRSPTKGDYV